jgi:hypothetical protein
LARFIGYFSYRETKAPEEISTADRRQSLNKIIVAWVFGVVFIEGIGGTPAVGLFRMFGASPAWIGLFVALPAITTILEPLSSYIIARTGSRKRYFLRVSYPGRFMWAVIVGLGFFLPHGHTGTLLILFFFAMLSRASLALSHPAWFSWASELPAKNELGEFWGRRQMWGQISGMVFLVLLSFYLGSDPTYTQFAVFFLILTVFGWMDIFIHRGVTGVKMDMEKEPSAAPKFGEMITGPLNDAKFRPLLIFSGCFAFANQLGGGMLHLMFLEEYNLSYFEISLYTPGLIGIMWIVGSRFWGRLIDNLREGDRLVFYVSAFMVATHVLIFPIIEARQHSLIALTIILGGLSWSGNQIATIALIIGISPSHQRPRYVATHMLFFGIGNTLGSIMAGQLAEAIAGLDMTVGPFMLTQFRTLYLISAVLRIACLPLLLRIQKPDSRPVGVYVRQIFSLNPFQRGTWMYVRSKFDPPKREAETD